MFGRYVYEKNQLICKISNTDGLVMMDSGGFQLMRRNIRITPAKVLEIYKQAEPDIGVVLDFPFNPLDLNSRMKRWKKTLKIQDSCLIIRMI